MGAPLGTLGTMQRDDVALNPVRSGGRWYFCNGHEPMMRYDIKIGTFEEAGMFAPGMNPNVAGVAGQLTGTYIFIITEYDAYHDVESDPGPQMSITLATEWATFTNWPVPNNPTATHFRVYRSLEGEDWATPEIAKATDRQVLAMAKVLEVAIVPPIGAQTDTILDDDDFQALLYSDGLSWYRREPPVYAYPVISRHRLFLWGQKSYNQGTVYATNGSKYVCPESETYWNRGIVGHRIVIGEDSDSYEVIEFMEHSPACLVLDQPYRGTSVSGAAYHTWAEDGKLVWSQADFPESFPNANHRYIAKGQGLRGTGIGELLGSPFLYTADQTWLLQYGDDPGADNMTQEHQLSGSVGCVGHRTIQKIRTAAGERLAWLSRFGIATSAGQGVEVVSDPPNYPAGMRPFFDDMDLDSKGEAQVACAANYEAGSLYLCAIPTEESDGGCDRVVVWDYELNDFWVWKFPWEIYSMWSVWKYEADLDDPDIIYRRQTIVMGTSHGYVMYWPAGENEGAERDDTVGTLEGTVTSASGNRLIDTTASFMVQSAESPAVLLGLQGAYVTVEAEDGTLQHREIVDNIGTELEVTPDFDPVPSDGDDYWIGEIESFYRTAKIDFETLIGIKSVMDLHVLHDIEDQGELGVTVYKDQDPTAVTLEVSTIDLTSATDPVYGRTPPADRKGRAKIPLNIKCYHYQQEFGNRKPNQPYTIKGMALKYEVRDD